MATKNKPITRKVIEDDLNCLILSGVNLTTCVLGQGSYGTVYKADYKGTACAAKQIDRRRGSPTTSERSKQNFLLECLQHSKLRHPNIVKMLGVFYPKKKTILPYLVMELMEYNLTQLLENHQNISMYVKLSILQDVSRGLCYLHTQNPPIVHQALYSDNILFTKGLTAKIGDFKTGAETVSDQALLNVRQNRNSSHFLPDSVHILKYDVSLNVFSFGCVVCHVITQTWHSIQLRKSHVSQLNGDISPLRSRIRTSFEVRQEINNPFKIGKILSYTMDDWAIEKHQNYIDLISDNSLKQLVEACLQRNPQNRPHMSLIYERITRLMTGMVGLMYIYGYAALICLYRSLQ